ncbi:MAG: hypothetical protein WAP52_02535 [Candidatus Sungiibacteriota bacterium]
MRWVLGAFDFSILLYHRDMEFFKKKQSSLYGVMEVGADAIKAMVFEMATDAALPRVREKFVWDLPVSCSALRLVKKIRESVFVMTEKIKGVPEKILIALGHEFGEYALQSWVFPMGDAPLTRKSIREALRESFYQHADLRRTIISAPVEVLVNRYPIRQEYWQENDTLSVSRAAEIQFRTLSLFMTVENGAMFAGIKNSLSGIPIEFIPLVIAEKEALVRDQNVRDAFLIDVGAEATALASIREGRLIHVAFMAFGIRRMAEIAAKKYRHPLHEAREMMRHYTDGSIRDEALIQASAAVADATAEWKKIFLQTLDAFYPTGPLSPNVLLSGGGARFPEIRAVVSERDWLGGFSYAEAPSVRVLEGAAFFGGNTLGGNLQGPEDAGLAALMTYSMSKNLIF